MRVFSIFSAAWGPFFKEESPLIEWLSCRLRRLSLSVSSVPFFLPSDDEGGGVWGYPYMTSALRGEGVSPKEDVVREVA